uniref:HMA domain-containing protein n=1 Tax=Hanusia phi TaxID=3032 RepID=A0A7S0HBB4_9CRYP
MLFRSAQAVEAACSVSLLCIDKTGTITEGKPQVTGMVLLQEGEDVCSMNEEGWEQKISMSCRELWRSVAACEVNVSHPLSAALQVFAARLASGDGSEEKCSPCVTKRKSLVGKGVVCWTSDGRAMAIGGSSLLELLGCPVSLPLAWRTAEQSVVYVLTAEKARQGEEEEEEELASYCWQARMAVALSDRVRDEAEAVIRRLRQLGIDVVLLSGDDPGVVQQVAAQVGIQQQFGGLSPLNKSQHVSLLRAQGARVAMVGDGINDIPAFAQADLSVSVAGGSKEALQSSDLVLAAGNLRLLLASFRLARATMRRIMLNLVWACMYNLVALPVAAGLFAVSSSIIVPPWMCAGMMSASSVLVVSCSLSLMSFRP